MRTLEDRAAKDWDVEGNGNPVHTHVCECCKRDFRCDCGFARPGHTLFGVVGCVECVSCPEGGVCQRASPCT